MARVYDQASGQWIEVPDTVRAAPGATAAPGRAALPPPQPQPQPTRPDFFANQRGDVGRGAVPPSTRAIVPAGPVVDRTARPGAGVDEHTNERLKRSRLADADAYRASRDSLDARFRAAQTPTGGFRGGLNALTSSPVVRGAGVVGAGLETAVAGANVAEVARDQDSTGLDVATQIAEGAGRTGATAAGAALGAKLGLLGGPFAWATVPAGAVIGGGVSNWLANRAIQGGRQAVGVDPTSPVDRVRQRGSAAVDVPMVPTESPVTAPAAAERIVPPTTAALTGDPESDRIAAITAAAQQPAALDVAGLNRDLAETITASRPEAPIYQPQARGDYNMYNTDQGALAARAAPTAGINFGFGVGGAPTAGEYLATMQAQDAQEARATQQRRAAAQAAIERSRYAQQMTSNNPFERRAARELLQGLDVREGLGVTEAGATQRQQMQGDASRDVAGLQGQFGVTQAGVQAQGGVEQQLIASEQRAQQSAAELAQDQAQFEMDPVNRRGAISTQLAQLMLQAGDNQGAINALYGLQSAGQPRPDYKMIKDDMGRTTGVMVNGVPMALTPEQVQELIEVTKVYQAPTQ